MSRIKRLALLLLALCLTGARAEELIAPDAIVPETANYRTAEIVRGDYTETAQSGASEVYPLTYRARYEGAEARFVRTFVKKGDEVKAGDPIAEVRLNASTVSLEGKQLSLQRAREAYEEGLTARQESLAAAQAALNAAADEFAREEARLKLERLRLETEKYRYEQERSIRLQEAAIEEAREAFENTLITAPADGIVSDVPSFREGEPIYSGWTMAYLYSTDRLLLRVKNEAGRFRYNMPVTIETGVAKSRTTVTGRVVATDLLLLPSDRKENVAYIALDAQYDHRELVIRNSQISAETALIKDALLIPRAALTLEAGSYFVSKLSGSRVEKRFVNARLSSVQTQWLLQGLEEGDLVILD